MGPAPMVALCVPPPSALTFTARTTHQLRHYTRELLSRYVCTTRVSAKWFLPRLVRLVTMFVILPHRGPVLVVPVHRGNPSVHLCQCLEAPIQTALLLRNHSKCVQPVYKNGVGCMRNVSHLELNLSPQGISLLRSQSCSVVPQAEGTFFPMSPGNDDSERIGDFSKVYRSISWEEKITQLQNNAC